MSIVIHRIDAPLVACAMMMSVDDTVKERVTEKHVRMSHVDLRTEHLLSVSIFSCLHLAEKLEVLLYAAVAVRALGSGNLNCSTSGTDLLLCLVINICETLPDELLCPLIELVEIARSARIWVSLMTMM